LFVSTTPAAAAEKRVAPVMGNVHYRHVGSLADPANDARLMAEGLGFTLVEGDAQLDLDELGLLSVVQSFGAQLQGADFRLLYYAGHGIQRPIGANPTKEAE
jgi:uncharacterized caspase-like protein